jgi:hypothetical protein
MSIQRISRKITPVAALLSLMATTAALASGPWQVSGWGARNEFTFGGQVDIQPTGAVAGHFTIVIDLPDGTHSACRYLHFYRGSVSRNVATFYLWGWALLLPHLRVVHLVQPVHRARQRLTGRRR